MPEIKSKALILLLITQAVSLTHIYHLEANKNNKSPLFLYKERSAIDNAPAAELLPDIQSFDDTLGGPQGELFPQVAETKPVKRKR